MVREGCGPRRRARSALRPRLSQLGRGSHCVSITRGDRVGPDVVVVGCWAVLVMSSVPRLKG